MSIFMTEKELTRIREAREANSQLGALWRALKGRTLENTKEDTLVQSSDTQLWWHLVWERLRDAASVYAIEPEEKLGQWLNKRVMEIVRMKPDEWVGPAFRARTEPPRAMLETAHIVKGIAEAYILCPELFTEEEKTEILTAMRERALPFCKEFIIQQRRSNWQCVIVDGYATAAILLDDKDAIEEALGYYKTCCGFYDEDGYGESLQYGNYASLSLSHMRDVLVRYDASLADRLPIDSIANTVKWAVSSFLYMKPLGGERGDVLFPRSINFGDSAAIFRPTADVLLQISAIYEDKTIAGLARWLFDTTYQKPAEGPDELATFGFYNHFSYVSLIYLPDAVSPLSPEEANMPLVNIYKTGTATIRDAWADNATVLGMQIGYDMHTVSGHRHADHNSFTLSYDKERYFIDPGHCCYRLKTWQESCNTDYHNTWDFYDEAGNRYTQTKSSANAEPLNKIVDYKEIGNFKILTSDCSAAYGEHFKRVERTWVTVFPNVLFIVDRIETDIPMKTVSHFVINNRDGKTQVKIKDAPRRVLRRGKGGMKFFTYTEEQPFELVHRYGFVHDNYHPLHNQIGQGKEGTAEILDLVSEYRTSHLFIHPFCIDDTVEVQYWHIRHPQPYIYQIQNKGNVHTWEMRLDPDKEDWITVEER